MSRRTTRSAGSAAASGLEDGRPLRADARRNRERVLETATAVFAAEGLTVPIHEIARRAGVGTGTVSRHFPTKAALYEAIVLDRVRSLVDRADELAGTTDPGTAFFTFFRAMAQESAANIGLGEAMAGAGYDVEAMAERTGYSMVATLGGLLCRAQEAGAVRADVDAADVKALLTGCLARSAVDPEGLERTLAVVCDGLRAEPAR